MVSPRLKEKERTNYWGGLYPPSTVPGHRQTPTQRTARPQNRPALRLGCRRPDHFEVRANSNPFGPESALQPFRDTYPSRAASSLFGWQAAPEPCRMSRDDPSRPTDSRNRTMPTRSILPAVLLLLLACLPTYAQEGQKPPAAADKMPMTGLAPSKLVPDLCVLTYRISTASPECQAHFD